MLNDPQLYLDIGDLGEIPQEEAIIDRIYVYPNNNDPAVKKFLRHLQHPTTVSDKEPQTLMSIASYIESWKIVKENKSSQGPHIVMYKSESKHPLLVCIFHNKY